MSRNRVKFVVSYVVTLLLVAGVGKVGYAHDQPYTVPTELLSMSLTGTGMLPLGVGYGLVDSRITVNESSSMASTGLATIRGGPGLDGGGPGDHLIDSFFDVFFDVTIMDIDPMNNYGGGLPSTLMNPSVLGPAHMTLQTFGTADPTKPNEGLLPPVGNAYIGHLKIVLPLGVDIGGSSDPDVLKFTLATHSVGDVTNTFIQGATVIDTFNSTAGVSGGVEDENTPDPPFGPFTLSGPTTASQQIIVQAIPEPSTLLLLGVGLGALAMAARRRMKK